MELVGVESDALGNPLGFESHALVCISACVERKRKVR